MIMIVIIETCDMSWVSCNSQAVVPLGCEMHNSTGLEFAQIMQNYADSLGE